MGVVIFWSVVGLIVSVVVLIIWYALITTAINASRLAQDVREIKELLQKQAGMDPATVATETDANADEQCPACGAGVQSTDAVCNSCGLTLILTDGNNEADNAENNGEDDDRDKK